jgi:hypothetical protein
MTTRRKSSNILKNNRLVTFGIIALLLLSPFILVFLSTGLRDAVIGVIAGVLNSLVLSNIFFCNLVVIGILTLAILIVLYIYSRIK